MKRFTSLALGLELLLKYYWDELYFPCDFYFDKDMDIRNNDVNYDNRGSHPEYDADYRVFIHIEDTLY